MAAEVGVVEVGVAEVGVAEVGIADASIGAQSPVPSTRMSSHARRRKDDSITRNKVPHAR